MQNDPASEKPADVVPWPKSEAELLAYVREMLAFPNEPGIESGVGYGRCVYAMANAAQAAFNYVAREIGVTGFQAGAAELTFVTQSRGMKHGALLLDGEKLLYPQYDLREQVETWIAETEARLGDEARKNLAGRGGHPDVRARWEAIAAKYPATPSPTPEAPADAR